jgi:hypothetical protein
METISLSDVAALLDYDTAQYYMNDKTFREIFPIPSSGLIKQEQFLF